MKSRLRTHVEGLYFTDSKLTKLAKAQKTSSETEDFLTRLGDKIHLLANEFGTGCVLLEEAVEDGRDEDTEKLLIQLAAIEKAIPKEVRALGKVLKTEVSDEVETDGAKILGL